MLQLNQRTSSVINSITSPLQTETGECFSFTDLQYSCAFALSVQTRWTLHCFISTVDDQPAIITNSNNSTLFLTSVIKQNKHLGFYLILSTVDVAWWQFSYLPLQNSSSFNKPGGLFQPWVQFCTEVEATALHPWALQIKMSFWIDNPFHPCGIQSAVCRTTPSEYNYSISTLPHSLMFRR